VWPGWRGPGRDGRVAWLPESLAAEPQFVWRHGLDHPGLGGIAVSERFVVFGDRDFGDFQDEFRCLDAETGEELWSVQRLAIGQLDYGNSPRATPLIVGNNAVCLGAFGRLVCIALPTGEVVWECDLAAEFPVSTELPWGYCGSPLLVDGKLIVAPGSPEASLIALDPADGRIIWKTPGGGPSHGSLVALPTPPGTKAVMIVGHDADSLGAWNAATGARLWAVRPPASGDFNVPTPIPLSGERLLITTENNGTRLFQLRENAVPTLLASGHRLHPDMSTPVVVGDRIYCVNEFLYCLSLTDGLTELWRIRDPALSDYAAILATDDRLLIVADGELLLMNADGSQKIEFRQRVFAADVPVFSHPALVGKRLYLRGEHEIVCLQL